CQINLECYQKQVNREFDTSFSVPVVYFTQLLGVALGIRPRALGFGKEFVPPTPLLKRAKRKKRVSTEAGGIRT
ncbi:MAG: hypothetical protein ACYSUN_11155, partial [Planctomycetota bacterium]